MTSAPDDERLVDMLLAGTPDRVADLAAREARAELDGLREALAMVGFALEPVRPSEGLRGRLGAALEGMPSPARPVTTALVVMDMLKDHLAPGSVLEVPRAREIVPAVKARIDRARAEGTAVFFLVDHHEAGDPELEDWSRHNTGEPLEELWPELGPAQPEEVVTHRTYSGFFGSRLDEALRARGVERLVLTGCVTEIHLFATATDALQRGYAVEVPADCQAGSDPMVEQVILGTLSIMRPVRALAATRASAA
ncbi:MAG: cysteine hydrolase [Deltaproteobacteria bacterium]|nr:cysteine hydrolase [Deltaproteobacteria bacterium]